MPSIVTSRHHSHPLFQFSLIPLKRALNYPVVDHASRSRESIIPFVAASSLAHLGERTIPDCGPFGYTVERYGRTNTYDAYTKNACTKYVHRGGRENRNNNDNNNHDDNIGSKIHRGERKRGGGNTCGESWVSGSNQTISGFASFLNPWSGSLHLSIPITCSFLRIPITKGERNGINAPLPRCLFALSKRFSFHAQRLIPRFWTKQIQG